MKLKLMLLLLMPLMLVSCANVNSYKEPRSGSQPLAKVTGSYKREDLTNWHVINVTSIDNKEISYGWSDNINVVPGNHLFVLQYEFHRGGFFSGTPNEGVTQIHANVKAGMNYSFVGKTDGAYMKIWMVDGAGRQVSGVVSSNYRPQVIQPMSMPVYIPSK